MGTKNVETRLLETLIEINTLINSQHRDVWMLLSRIMESAEHLIGTDASSLLMIDEGTGQLYFEVALGDKGEDVKKYTLDRGEGIAGWVAQTGTSLLVNDVKDEPRHFKMIADDTGYKIENILAVPLRVQNETIGVLEVINKVDGGKFSDEDTRLLEIFADQAAIALQYGKVSRELDSLRRSMVEKEVHFGEKLIWKSPAMEGVVEEADKIAFSDSPVLIIGESGTGKELFAERIHKASPRKNAPMIFVNCSAIPPQLAEAELFGYVKGAFTDAVRDKKGFFERAEGGSLFLDEVADLPNAVQGKLLRAIQNKRFQRVGGERDIIVDVRVLAATNKDLAAAADAGTFRRDLYYRLAVFILEIPPLRERLEDIEVLARHFLARFRSFRGGGPRDFTLEALSALLASQWPGNVRELRNTVERAVVVGRGDAVTVEDLDLTGKQGVPSPTYKGKALKEAMTLFKRNFIRGVLASHGGNQTAAARDLDIQRTYLSKLIREFGIEHQGEQT